MPLAWPDDPVRFCGIFISIRAFTTVMDPVTRQRCARPGDMTTAASSAARSGWQASSMRSRNIWSQHDFSMLKFRSSSRVRVWWAPMRTCSDSSRFGPDSRTCSDVGSKSTLVTSIVRDMRTLFELVDPVDDSFTTLRNVVHRTKSPTCNKLYECHKSSGVSGLNRTVPPPSLAEIFFFNSFISVSPSSHKNVMDSTPTEVRAEETTTAGAMASRNNGFF
mmetsp:Transcript_28093/g.51162  ORF Transcript_28093/g.51162 Transcript_28093/m.51162 type:complete len:220 (+) Transcript_28093:1601-2260(+)